MTAALYARVSTKDKGQPNDNQLRELRAFAERLGYSVYLDSTGLFRETIIGFLAAIAKAGTSAFK